MRIAIMADSHGWGTNPPIKAHLESLGHEVVYAVYENGWSADRYVEDRAQLAHLLETDPDTIIVSLGGNNHRLSDRYADSVQDLLDELDFQERQVIWIGPAAATHQDTSKRHEWTADFLGAYLSTKGISFIDSRPFTQTHHKKDGVHFTREGYQTWAAGIAPHLTHAVTPRKPEPFKSWPYFVVGGSILLLILALKKKGKI
jgi:lysophospholipase L1-like esterase